MDGFMVFVAATMGAFLAYAVWVRVRRIRRNLTDTDRVPDIDD